MVNAIPLAATRSKIGQYPRLYLRVLFADRETFMGDPREDVLLEPDRNLRAVNELTVDLTRLGKRLERFDRRIEQVLVFQDADLRTTVAGEEVKVAAWLRDLLGADRVKTIGERT